MTAIRRRARRAGAVLALTTLATGMVGLAAPSWACACGALFADEPIGVNDESVVVRVGEETQTVVLSLGVEAAGSEAALVLPTPEPAEVELADPEMFNVFARLSQPEIEYTRDWWPRRWFEFNAGVGSTEEGSAVEVLSETRLGSFDVATLAAEDPDALTDWLDGHGYDLDDDIARELEPYVEEGWYYVAVKLASEEEEEPLHGELEPIRVEFAAEEPVYPMRLSSAADHGQSVRVYMLAEHRMERVDDSAEAIPPEVAFAGRVTAEDTGSAEAAELIGEDGAFLTTLDHVITDPARITSDFHFAPAAEDAEEQRVETVSTPYYILGIAAGPFVVAASVLGLALLGVLPFVVRRLRRRTRGAETTT